MSCWHSLARVRGLSPDSEQVALQLCPGWPCQLAHPLGQAWKPQGSLLGPRVRLPIGVGTSYWGMGQCKSCIRQAEALCMYVPFLWISLLPSWQRCRWSSNLFLIEYSNP